MQFDVTICRTILSALLVGSSFTHAQAQSDNRYLLERDSNALLDKNGVWRSRGYGRWWVVKDGRVTVYDAGVGYCTRRWQRWGLPGRVGRRMLVSPNGRTVRLTLGDRTYFHTFDRVASLPSACHSAVDLRPRAIFESAASILSEHYAFFAQRGVNWDRHLESRRQQIHNGLSQTDLFWELAALVKPIDDGHVGIEGYVDGRRRRYDPPQRRRPITADERRRLRQVGYWSRNVGLELVGDKIRSIGDGRVKYGLIGDDVAYLYVASTGRSLLRALNGPLDEARELFRGSRALIIDLSKNFGGWDYIARRLASRFTIKPTLAYYKYAADDPMAKPQPIYVRPSDKLLFDGPIFVMTSASTLSAAEILVMSLRALPNVTHIGSATRGALSDILAKRLPNGWTLSLSNEVYLDNEQTAWEGIGIKPHIEFVVKRWTSNNKRDLAAAGRVLDYVLKLPVRKRVHKKPRT